MHLMTSTPEELNHLTARACPDCLIAIANDDYSGMDDDRAIAVRAGIEQWYDEGYRLVPGDTVDPSFMWAECDICHGLAGDRYDVIAIPV